MPLMNLTGFSGFARNPITYLPPSADETAQARTKQMLDMAQLQRMREETRASQASTDLAQRSLAGTQEYQRGELADRAANLAELQAYHRSEMENNAKALQNATDALSETRDYHKGELANSTQALQNAADTLAETRDYHAVEAANADRNLSLMQHGQDVTQQSEAENRTVEREKIAETREAEQARIAQSEKESVRHRGDVLGAQFVQSAFAEGNPAGMQQRVLSTALAKAGVPEFQNAWEEEHGKAIVPQIAPAVAELRAYQDQGKTTEFATRMDQLKADPQLYAQVQAGLAAPRPPKPVVPAAAVAPPNETPGYLGATPPGQLPPALKLAFNWPKAVVNAGTDLYNYSVIPATNLLTSAFGAPPVKKVPKQPYVNTYGQAFAFQ